MKKYGIMYKGSKNKIAEDILNILPSADNFYDLFAGGCAITHRALLSNKYKNIVANDINDMPKLFLDAIEGKYKDEDRWISREMFFENINDPYISSIWSFAGNCKSYMYSKEIEPYKKALWYAVMFDDWTDFEQLMPETLDRCKNKLNGITDKKERRLLLQAELSDYIKELDAKGDKSWKQHTLYKQIKTDKGGMQGNVLVSYERIQRLESLQSLERLRRLQSLQSLERLQQNLIISKQSYDEVEIKPNSIIYCDIPYINTDKYSTDFDYDKFYEWALKQEQPIYISEYWMPGDKFECIWEKDVVRKFFATKVNICKEKLFIPKR